MKLKVSQLEINDPKSKVQVALLGWMNYDSISELINLV